MEEVIRREKKIEELVKIEERKEIAKSIELIGVENGMDYLCKSERKEQ